RDDRHRGAPVRGVGGPRGARAGLPRPRRARAHDPPPALLRRPHAVADRAADRDLADARLAPDPPLAREDPRRDSGTTHRGDLPPRGARQALAFLTERRPPRQGRTLGEADAIIESPFPAWMVWASPKVGLRPP